MFDDPNEELRRLQQRLLAEEDREEPEPDEDWLADVHDFPDDDLWEEDDEEPEDSPEGEDVGTCGRKPRKRGAGCLMVLLCLELLGIAAVAAYWALVLL